MALQALGYPNYGAYLRSAHWRKLKARYWASDRSQDCMCGETEGLQLHHMTYERIGQERLTDLTPLCPNCHAMIHTLERRGEIGLDFSGFVSEERAKRNRKAQDTRLAAIRAERLTKAQRREVREQLPFEVRLRLVLREAKRRGINVSSRVRVIERHLWKLERSLGIQAPKETRVP